MQIKQQLQNFQVKICGKNESCTNKCLFYLVERFGLPTRGEANSGLLRSNIPLSTFSSGLLKFLCPPSPLLLWGFWIESSSCLVLQVSWHICQGCTEIGRSPFKIAKNTRKTTMAQPVSGSTSTCVLWLRTRYSRHFPFSIVLSSSLP